MPVFGGNVALDRQPHISEVPASFGEMLGATAREAFEESPTKQLLGIDELGRAKDETKGPIDRALDMGERGPVSLVTPIVSALKTAKRVGDWIGGYDTPQPVTPELTGADAKAKVEAAGLSKILHLDESPIREGALDIMMKRAAERNRRETTISRGPAGVLPGIMSVGTSLFVGALDPLNVGAAFIPIVGEARWGKLMASAGESAINRAGVRAGLGAGQGAAFTAAFQPLEAWAHTQEGRDFTMGEALHNVLMGAGTFGLLHVGGGAAADVYRGFRGRPLYPYGEGEPMGPAPKPMPHVATREPDPRLSIFNDVVAQLRSAGMDADEAAQNASVVAERYAARAQRIGTDPYELYRQEGLEVTRGAIEGVGQTHDQPGTPAFDSWFGESKVRGADGAPLVVYHGTKSSLEGFDLSKAGASDPGLVGRAIYFTPTAEQASSFAESGHYGRGEAPNVIPAYVSIKNPLIIQDGKLPDGRTLTQVHPQGITKESAAALQREIKKSGHDGVIFKSGDEIVQVAAFDPRQVKSIFNRGTYDPNDPRILNQAAKTPSPDLFTQREAEGQTSLPGTERIGEGEQAQRAADQPLKPKVAQKPMDVGLFGDESKQKSFFQNAPTFFSAVERAVESAKQDKASPEQWLGMIKNASGVKAEELEWLGLESWLKEQSGPVTKQALADYVRANRIEVREVMRGEKPSYELSELADILLNGYNIPLNQIRTVRDVEVARLHNEHFEEAVRGRAPEEIVAAAEEARNANKGWEAVQTRSGPGQFANVWRVTDPEGGVHEVSGVRTVDEAIDQGRYKARQTSKTLPKFSSWMTPKGLENERELVLTLPAKPDPTIEARINELRDEATLIGNEWAEKQRDLYELARTDKQMYLTRSNRLADIEKRQDEIQNELRELGRKRDGAYRVPSGHGYGDEASDVNRLAHIFTADATIDGKKTLLIREGQSDWHQAGHKLGYRTELTAERRIQLEAEKAALWASQASRLDAAGAESMQRIGEIDRELGGTNAPPDAPFKTTWPALVLKRMIRYAAEHNYEKLAWVTGDTVAERYDLSKQISRVSLHKLPNRNEHFLKAFDHENNEVINKAVTNPEKELPELIGKEAAEKLLRQEVIRPREIPVVKAEELKLIETDDARNYGDPDGRYVRVPKSEMPDEETARRWATRNLNKGAEEINERRRQGPEDREISGLDLKIGGEFHRKLYDDVFVREANKLVKKYGAKVEQEKVQTASPEKLEIDQEPGGDWAVYDDNRPGESIMTFGTRQEAEDFARDRSAERTSWGTVVHTLPITDDLRKAAVEQGFPLFQKGAEEAEPRGRITLSDNKAIVQLFSKANASTFMHEMGHLWLEEMMRDAAHEKATPGVKADLQTILGWLGVARPEDIATEHHEQWARGFEQYLREGSAPSASLAGAFARFKEWLLSIYRALTDLGTPITPEIRGVMDRMLATDEQIASYRARRPSPAVEIIADLPPRAKTDIMQGSIASMINGEPVRAGEMVEAGAARDPRIQESIDRAGQSENVSSETLDEAGTSGNVRDIPSIPVDNARDVRSGAVASKDPGGPVYIDPHIPEFSLKLTKADGTPARLWTYLAVHETEERRAMAEGMPYEQAHADRATPAERAAVQADGVDWTAYTHEMDGYLASIEHEGVTNPPPDPHVDPDVAVGGRPHHHSENKAVREEIATAPPGAENEFPSVHIAPKATRGPRARDPETWSLLEFIASRGGIDPNDGNIGDVRGLFGNKRKFIPGFGDIVRQGGMKLDTMREAAVEAGYLHDPGWNTNKQATTTITDLLDAMDNENRGQKVYKYDRMPEDIQRKAILEENLRDAENRFDDALVDGDLDPTVIDPKLYKRTLEIMTREGENDPILAFERAIAEDEERYDKAANVRRSEVGHIPGWDEEPHDARAAPAGGREAAGRSGEFAGRLQAVAPGEVARPGGEPDRAIGGADEALSHTGPETRAAWSEFARPRRPADEPDVIAASEKAASLPEPGSLAPEPDKRVQAAEKAAADAEAIYNAAAPYLPEDIRAIVDRNLLELDRENQDSAHVLQNGAACLAAAVGMGA